MKKTRKNQKKAEKPSEKFLSSQEDEIGQEAETRKPKPNLLGSDLYDECEFVIKDSFGGFCRVLFHNNEGEDEMELELSVDTSDADGEIDDDADGPMGSVFLERSELEALPINDREDYLYDQMTDAMYNAGFYKKIGPDNPVIRDLDYTATKWAVRQLEIYLGEDDDDDATEEESSGSPTCAEKIIKNPLTSRIQESLAKSKARLNFAFPFLSPFALSLLDKKSLSKIPDKRIITRFDPVSLSSFDLPTLKKLLGLGFKIRYSNILHLKLYIADGDAYVTSSNFTKGGFEDNIELSVKVDPSNTQKCAAIFEDIWDACWDERISEELLNKNWNKYEFLRMRAKYDSPRHLPAAGEACSERSAIISKIVKELVSQGIEHKTEKLIFEANRQRAERKNQIQIQYDRTTHPWVSFHRDPVAGVFYEPEGDPGRKNTVFYDLSYGNERKLSDTGLREDQFKAVFEHKDFKKVVIYMLPEIIGMKSWDLGDQEMLLKFCNGIFAFEIPQYAEALPIRLASYFYPDYFMPIFKLDLLGKICETLGLPALSESASAGVRFCTYSTFLAKHPELSALPCSNYTKAGIVHQIHYAVDLYDRLTRDGVDKDKEYKNMLDACDADWKRKLVGNGMDLLKKLKLIE